MFVAGNELVRRGSAGKPVAVRAISASAATLRVANQDHIREAHMIVDDGAAGEIDERPCLEPAGNANAEDEIFLREAPVLDERREHQLRTREIIMIGGARAVVALEARLQRQGARQGMARA